VKEEVVNSPSDEFPEIVGNPGSVLLPLRYDDVATKDRSVTNAPNESLWDFLPEM
jgi:hypothetical protein